MARNTYNGFPVYDVGEACEGCGLAQNGDPEDPNPEAGGGYYLECPECYSSGCEECMPMGRGCRCPDCEDRE